MLAIVIPYYKSTFFEETLASLAKQTNKHFKVYIGDDASPDSPVFVLDKYKEKFDFAYHRFEINFGGISLTQQWERCIDLSEDEEWLMILGDDDVLGENVVEEFNTFIQDNKRDVDLIRFNLRVIDSDGKFQSDNFEHRINESANDLLERMFLLKETITVSEFVFSRAIYSQNNGFVDFPLAWFSDYATWLVFSEKKGFCNIKQATVYWRLSGINISSQSSNLSEIKLKVKSLFLFMHFLQVHFRIDSNKLKKFTHAKLHDLLCNIPFFQSARILNGEFFKFKFNKIIVFEFIFKKIKRKTLKTYEGICAT
jgi:glycosyltransferase involved in cell wall biosynthesis